MKNQTITPITKPPSMRDTSRVVWRYIRPYRRRFILGTLFRLAAELAFTISPYAFAKLITNLANHAPSQFAYTYFGIWVITHFIRIAGQRFGRWFANRVRERSTLDAEIDGLDALVRWPLIAHEAENSGNKIKRIQGGVEAINRILTLLQDQWIAIASHGIIMIAVITTINWQIGIVFSLFLISYWFLTKPLMHRAGKRARKVNAQEEAVGGFMFEIASSIRTVKVMNLYGWLRVRLVKLVDDLEKLVFARVAAFQSGGAITNTYALTVRMALLGYVVYGVIQGRFEIGFLLLFNNYFANLRELSEQLVEGAEEYSIARFKLDRFEEIFNIAGKNRATGSKTFPINWQEININDVSFAYGANQVLNNVNLTIKRGERVGIVGLSGAGKTTLFKLLLKEHTDYAGEIKIGNISVRDLELQSFSKHTAVVLQDTEVFNLSLHDNIVLGVADSEQTDERLAKAIAVSHVQDFIYRLPNGLDTLIGEKGVKLSGGERQRVGLARAIYKNPQILFLDEATSHIDIESEEKIQVTLHEFFSSVTAVVIAHRLTTIKEMDRIVVLEDGAIIESGTFDELYKKHGRFYDLWEKQKL